MGRAAIAAIAALSLFGCDTEQAYLEHLQGSTLRIEQPVVEDRAELELKIFTKTGDCVDAGVREDEMDLCLPYVDRGSGEVRLGFEFKLDTQNFPMRLTPENLDLVHLKQLLNTTQPQQRMEIIPHNPIPIAQLFILVIDGSSSMEIIDDPTQGESRMDKVRQALLQPEVVERFFPQGVNSGVVLMTFTNGAPRPVGTREITVIRKPGRYRKLVRNELRPQGGFTHLYDAVGYASVELLQDPTIREFLDDKEAIPTIVALTDGFNNEKGSDSCGDNAPRLNSLLKRLGQARGREVDLLSRPEVFTVGLGRGLRRSKKIKSTVDPKKLSVTPRQLCGPKHVDSRIDSGLEEVAIDNASLAWIAAHGGGFSYARQDAKGLAKAFREAAAERYEWFEVRYSVPPFYLRRSFSTLLRLNSYTTAETTIRIHPSAWFDRPPGRTAADGWTRAVPFRSSLALLMPIFGALVGLSYVGAAGFNTRRVLFGRTRKPKARKDKGKEAPEQGPPSTPPAAG